MYLTPSQLGNLSKYRAMWLFTMFDVPVGDRRQRRRYSRLRNGLLAEGFTMLQFSVYAKHVPSEETAKSLRARLRKLVPPDGEVRMFAVTETQFARMEVYVGKMRKEPDRVPDQLLFL